ncbi:MAG: hypothetical protein IKF90_00680 [Parasporobacterium sp.]|nr:hypothetical protein [Parasporobacterium sp.]
MATQVDASADAEIYMSNVTRNGAPETFRFAVLNDLLIQQVGIVLFDHDAGIAGRDVFSLEPGDEIEANGKKFTIGINGLTLNSGDIKATKYIVQFSAYDMFGNEFKADTVVMRTIEDLYKEIQADKELKQEFVSAFKEGQIEEFLSADDCDAKAADVMVFLKETQDEVASEDDLTKVAGGWCTGITDTSHCT